MAGVRMFGTEGEYTQQVSCFIQGLPGSAEVFLVRQLDCWQILDSNRCQRSEHQFSLKNTADPDKLLVASGEEFKFAIKIPGLTWVQAFETYRLSCNPWRFLPKSWFGFDGKILWVVNPVYLIVRPGEWNENNKWSDEY